MNDETSFWMVKSTMGRNVALSSVMIMALSQDRSKMSSTIGWLGAISIRGLKSETLTNA